MFVRAKRRFKDGKEHRYWSVVENRRRHDGRVVQRQVLYLGEINDSQRAAWCRSIDVLRDASGATQMALFPADREAPDLACEVVRVNVGDVSLHRPRQWGACWLALTLWERLELDRFWGPRLPASRQGTRWLDVLKAQVCYQLIEPGSDWRLHRHWYENSALSDLLGGPEILSCDALYRCLDKLEAHRRAFFSFLRERWETLFEARFDVLLYDLTTSWNQKFAAVRRRRGRYAPCRSGSRRGQVGQRDGVTDGHRVLADAHLRERAGARRAGVQRWTATPRLRACGSGIARRLWPAQAAIDDRTSRFAGHRVRTAPRVAGFASGHSARATLRAGRGLPGRRRAGGACASDCGPTRRARPPCAGRSMRCRWRPRSGDRFRTGPVAGSRAGRALPATPRRRARRRGPADCRRRRLAVDASRRCRGTGSSECACRWIPCRNCRSSARSCSRTRRTRKVPGAGSDRLTCAARSADSPPGAAAPGRRRFPRRWPERATRSMPRGAARRARSGAEPSPPCACRCGCGAPACPCRRSSDRAALPT